MNWLVDNQSRCQQTLSLYPGLRSRYRRLVDAFIQQRDPADLKHSGQAAVLSAVYQALREPGSVTELPADDFAPDPVPCGCTRIRPGQKGYAAKTAAKTGILPRGRVSRVSSVAVRRNGWKSPRKTAQHWGFGTRLICSPMLSSVRWTVAVKTRMTLIRRSPLPMTLIKCLSPRTAPRWPAGLSLTWICHPLRKMISPG